MANLLLVRPSGADVGALRSTVETQQLRPEDVDAVAHCYWRSYAEGADAFPLDDARADVERYLAGGYGEPIAAASRVVRRHGAVVAAVLTVRDAPYDDVPRGPFVIDLFVLPEDRRGGLGAALMVAAVAAVPGEPVGLRVDTENVAARSLYAHLGFAVPPD